MGGQGRGEPVNSLARLYLDLAVWARAHAADCYERFTADPGLVPDG